MRSYTFFTKKSKNAEFNNFLSRQNVAYKPDIMEINMLVTELAEEL